MKKVAICSNPYVKEHSTLWSQPWVEYCKEHAISYEVVNPFALNFMEQLDRFNILLWHFSGYNYTEMLFARSILYSAKQKGLNVFPDFHDCWHFDDKIAQTYLLESVNAPIPESQVFYTHEDVQQFVDTRAVFPLVGKLRNGSGAHNVKMLSSAKELLAYSKQMFSTGISSTPNALYKASSNIKSAYGVSVFLNRAKRIPEFLRTLRSSRQFAKEKGYVYLQKFVPNKGYDLKVVVVGDKLSFIGRNTRKGDFRASGGGSLFYERDKITQELIDIAFATNDSIGFQCMGYDFVINEKNNAPIIIEISYGFSHQALLDSKGHYDRNGVWHDVPLNAPKELLANLMMV